MIVLFKKLDPRAKLPQRSSPGASGFDLCALEDGVIEPHSSLLVKTGLSVELPYGYEMQIRSRSGLALKNNVIVANSPGTIDRDYRGEIGVILYNLSNHLMNKFIFNAGDRIAQAVFAPVEIPELVRVEELSETQRGSGGFGSTGR